jgi:hypothetical protein
LHHKCNSRRYSSGAAEGEPETVLTVFDLRGFSTVGLCTS